MSLFPCLSLEYLLFEINGSSLSLGFPQLCTLSFSAGESQGTWHSPKSSPKQTGRGDYSGHLLLPGRPGAGDQLLLGTNISSSIKTHPRSCLYLDCFTDVVYNGAAQAVMLAGLGQGVEDSSARAGQELLELVSLSEKLI